MLGQDVKVVKATDGDKQVVQMAPPVGPDTICLPMQQVKSLDYGSGTRYGMPVLTEVL